jgi:hypothetical protein
MSGGSYDYAYYKVYDFADDCVRPHTEYCYSENVERKVPADNLELRQRFADHLKKVAKVMKEIEWCDSGDTGPDDLKIILEDFLSNINEPIKEDK